tara:strand:+ start:22361 stop:22543 length:183 start_codon:yes stop_codon:yes gene_type:complete
MRCFLVLMFKGLAVIIIRAALAEMPNISVAVINILFIKQISGDLLKYMKQPYQYLHHYLK